MIQIQNPKSKIQNHPAFRLLLLIVLLGGLAVTPAVASQEDVTIGACTEDAFDVALDRTSQGGSIFFDCGGPATITFTSTKPLNTSRRISGGGMITLSGGGAVRLFTVAPGANVTLDGLTLTGGRASGDSGGAIFNQGALELDSMALIGNAAASGGALYNTGTVSVTETLLRDNTASSNGGAIVNAAGGKVDLAQSVIGLNRAGVLGGGFYNLGTLTISGGNLRDNQALMGGGGIILTGTVAITTTIVSGNRAGQDGGGLYNQGELSLAGTTISGNSAGGNGAGVLNSRAFAAVNTTLSGNLASGNGGGVANLDTMSLRAATITGNGAVSGGGIFNASGGTAALRATILAGNLQAGGQANDCAGALTSQGYNLVQQSTGCSFGSTTGDLPGMDPLLGPLFDNGGPTPTHALRPGSPAADLIPVRDCVLADQRGVARPVGPECDSGAYELGFVVDSPADAPDANQSDSVCRTEEEACTLRAAIMEANAVRGMDAIVFATDMTVTLTREGSGVSDADGELDIRDSLLLTGFGAGRTIIDGGGDPAIGGVVRVSAMADVTITDVTIRNGNAGGNTFGGGVRNEGRLRLARSIVSGSSAANGGGVTNFGQLTIDESLVRGNSTSTGDGGVGGGIDNRLDEAINLDGGRLTLRNSTIDGNRADRDGGGIASQGVAELVNVTISANRASGHGGGIWAMASQPVALSLNNVTLVGNTADDDNDGMGDGGGLFSAGGDSRFKNTIIAGNTDRSGQAPDCVGRPTVRGVTLQSLGYNLVGSNLGCEFDPAHGDKIGVSAQPLDPRLSELQQRGGVAPVHRPLSGSPAVNAGSPTPAGGLGDSCAATDQVGRSRPAGAACDIGADEAPLADVQLTMAATPQPALVAGRLNYTYRLTNLGPETTGGVSIRAGLPAGTSLLSVTWSQGECSVPGEVRCAFGQLNAGTTVTVTLTVRPLAGGATVGAASATASETDPNLENNSASQRANVLFGGFLPAVGRDHKSG